MKLLVLLAVAAMPVMADEPAPILISPEERRALVEKFGRMQEHIEALEKRLKHCITATQS